MLIHQEILRGNNKKIGQYEDGRETREGGEFVSHPESTNFISEQVQP